MCHLDRQPINTHAICTPMYTPTPMHIPYTPTHTLFTHTHPYTLRCTPIHTIFTHIHTIPMHTCTRPYTLYSFTHTHICTHPHVTDLYTSIHHILLTHKNTNESIFTHAIHRFTSQCTSSFNSIRPVVLVHAHVTLIHP